MTIEQMIDVPASRRVFFDLPPELPAGRAKVELTITPEPVLQETGGRGKIHLTKEMVDEMMQDETLRSLTGILHTEMSIEEIRNERLSKHLK